VLLVRSKAIFGSQPTPPRPEVEVKLDLAQIQEYLKMEKLVQAIKGLQPPETDQYTAEAVSKFSTDANKMFAQLRDFKLEPMTREVDQELLDNAVKMFQPKETPRTDRMVPAEDELLDRRTVMIDALRQNAASSGELVSLLGELLRAQRDQNDISSRLLQVASN
jgi:hypothetical protein